MRTINTIPKHAFKYNENPNPLTFAVLDGDQYLHTPCMCKDYLQDIFWSVHTGYPVPEVHGLTWDPSWLRPQDRFDLALADRNSALASKCARMQEFLNLFDSALGIYATEVYPTTDEKIVIVSFSKQWTVSGPMISAFTTLIRLGGGYDGSGVKEYLKALVNKGPMSKYNRQTGGVDTFWAPDPGWMRPEVERLKSIAPRMLALLAGKRPAVDWKPGQSIYTIHNEGVIGFAAFPTVDF